MSFMYENPFVGQRISDNENFCVYGINIFTSGVSSAAHFLCYNEPIKKFSWENIASIRYFSFGNGYSRIAYDSYLEFELPTEPGVWKTGIFHAFNFYDLGVNPGGQFLLCDTSSSGVFSWHFIENVRIP